MPTPFRPVLTSALIAITGLAAFDRSAAADEFRIQSTLVLVDGEKEQLLGENTTLFRAGMVYDFLDAPREITVLHPTRQLVIVLDPDRQVKCEISTDDLTAFCSQLQTRAAASKDALLRFMAEPKFEEQRDGEAGPITLTSPLMVYRVASRPADNAEVSRQYVEFCNWYARLNPMLIPGASPPFARLALNNVLAREQVVATEVELTVYPDTRHERRLRSKHAVSWRLLSSDRDRIERVEQYIHTFDEVSPFEYHRAPAEQASR